MSHVRHEVLFQQRQVFHVREGQSCRQATHLRLSLDHLIAAGPLDNLPPLSRKLKHRKSDMKEACKAFYNMQTNFDNQTLQSQPGRCSSSGMFCMSLELLMHQFWLAELLCLVQMETHEADLSGPEWLSINMCTACFVFLNITICGSSLWF